NLTDAQPERVVVTQAESGITYRAGDMARNARRMAQWLAAQGLQAGDTVAVLLENRREILELVLAAREAGLYAAVISTHLTPAEVRYIAHDSGSKLLLVSSKTWPNAQSAAQELGLPAYSVDRDTPGTLLLQEALAEDIASVDLSQRPL